MNEKSYCIITVNQLNNRYIPQELSFKDYATACAFFVDCCKYDKCVHCEFYEIGENNSYCDLIAMGDYSIVEFY